MITISIHSEETQRQVRSLFERCRRPRGMLGAMGREGQQRLKRHFREKDRKEPNRLSQRRSHFWREVDLSVTAPVIVLGDTGVRVSVTHPAIAQKVFGGRITAKRAQLLTIPVSEEAYGRTAETFEAETGKKLFLIADSRFAMLATRRSADSKLLQIEYVLKRFVDQRPTPEALPDMGPASPFVRALLDRGEAVLRREAREAGTA